MATDLLDFPLALVVDGILSFLQYRFANPAIVPDLYRWHSDEKCSRIRISGQYSIDNVKPGSIPSITVRRTNFQFAHRAIDNLGSADANVFTNPKYEDWLDGFIEIICESMVASEASTLANFLAIEIQANRKEIVNTLEFMRYLSYYDVGPETIIEKTVETRRWQVVLRLKTSIYLGWIKRSQETIPFNKIALRDISSNHTWQSSNGILTQGEPYIEDNTADFGLLTTNNPQLLEAELNKKWYYIIFDGDTRLYQVEEIITNHKLRLSDKDKDDLVVPFNSAESKTGVLYTIAWNSVHIHIELPKHS